MHVLVPAGLLTTGLGLALGFLPATAAMAQPPRGNYAQAAAPSLVRWEAFARSVENRPLEMAQFGSGPRHILVLGSLAGDDAVGRWMAERLAAHLARFPRRLDEATVVVVRDGNPDGRARRSSGNAHGIELDQNFATGDWRKIQAGDRYTSGVTPLTEPECRALTELIKDIRPERVIILADGSTKGTVACIGSDELARRVSVETGISILPADGLATSGSLAALAGRDQGIPTVLLNLPPRVGRRDNWDELKPSIMMALAADDGRQAAPVAAATAVPAAGIVNNSSVPAIETGQVTVTERPVPADSATSDNGAVATPAAPVEKVISAEALKKLPKRVPVSSIPGYRPPSALPINAPKPTPTAAPAKPTPRASAVPGIHRATPVPRGGSSPSTAIKKKPGVNLGKPLIQRLPAAGADHPTIKLPQEPIPLYPSTGM